MGDVPSAVDDYHDIPKPVRERLKARMIKREYDEIVKIKRDTIEGKRKYRGDIKDMHFGTTARPKMCGTVTRLKWKHDDSQRGLVYCEDNYCILVPTICRNVSRIEQEDGSDAEGDGIPELMLDPRPFIPPPFSDSSPSSPVVSTDDRNNRHWPNAGPGSGFYGYPRPGGSVVPNNPPMNPPIFETQPVAEVPEPSTIWLFLLGAAFIAVRFRCK